MPRSTQIHPATLDELAVITTAMQDELRLAVQLGAWCALRYGEVFELRRKDTDTVAGVVHVRRGVVWTKGLVTNDRPKTSAGGRDVTIPPHPMPMVTRDPDQGDERSIQRVYRLRLQPAHLADKHPGAHRGLPSLYPCPRSLNGAGRDRISAGAGTTRERSV